MEPKRTTCPFCLNGCESAVVFDGYQYRMEYVADGKVNLGKLCPRGNSANVIVDHPKRLAYPLVDGRETDWTKAIEQIKGWLTPLGPEQVAIVFSRGLSERELGLVAGFAKAIGTKNLSCGHIEPENYFNYRVDGVKPVSLDQVREAKAMLLVGDVFMTSPVAAGPIVDARYADRGNRLVVMDSLKTRQSGFAHVFIQVRPGTEPFALLALAGMLDKKLKGIDVEKMAGLAGADKTRLEAAAKIMGSGAAGFVGSAMHLGRVRYPMLHSLASQLVALKAGMPFVGFGEARLPLGPMSLAKLRQSIEAGSIRMLFWFGGLYPYSYPELAPELGRVEHRVATSIFRPESALPGYVLPVPSELEKETVGHSYWGEVSRSPVATPYSGTRAVSWIIEQFSAGVGPAGFAASPSVKPEGVVSKAADAAAGHSAIDGEWLLVGEKRAIGIKGIYDPEDRVRINPSDAAKLEVVDESYVKVESETSSGEYRVHVSEEVPAGVLAVGVNRHANRALFPLKVSKTDDISIPPAPVRVTRSERLAEPASEARAEV
jgi:anaerobic selenocysteine-containing dehydrogenase